jgi:hypothetical protein
MKNSYFDPLLWSQRSLANSHKLGKFSLPHIGKICRGADRAEENFELILW